MATNLPSCFFIQFLEQLLKFLVNFNLLKYVTSQRSYGLLITKELIFGFQILDLKDHFSSSLKHVKQDNALIIICHYSICEACRSTSLLTTEHQPANYMLCFLSEAKLFSLIVDLNKNILAAFITRLVRHPGKQT